MVVTVPVETVILILPPYFAAAIATIIYVHKKSRKINDNDNNPAGLVLDIEVVTNALTKFCLNSY